MQTTFVGFTDVETVTVQVTDASGNPLSQGFVTLQVNGQSVYAPVVNGRAVVSAASGLLDIGQLYNLFFTHSLTVGYSDPGGFYFSSGTATSVPPILLEYYFFLIGSSLAPLNQG